MSQPVRISATIRDAWGIETSTVFSADADTSQEISALQSDVFALGLALDSITDGQITRLSCTIEMPIPIPASDMKTAPVAGSRVEQTGLLGFSATGSSKRYTAEIPALSNDPGVLVGDRIKLTPLYPVSEFVVTLFTTANLALTYTNEVYQPLIALTDAAVSTRKQRRQLQRSSFEVS